MDEPRGTDEKDVKKKEIIYHAQKVRNILQGIEPDDARLMGFTNSKPVDLIIQTLAVAPPQIRPSIEMNPEKRAEDDITTSYMRIISINKDLLSPNLEANERN